MGKVLDTLIPVFSIMLLVTMPFWLPLALNYGMKRQVRKRQALPPGTKTWGLYVRIK